MAIPAQARDLLEAAVADGVGSAAALAWQCANDRAMLALGRTALSGWPNQPISSDSLFDLASLTKPMATLTLLVGEMAAGRVALGDRLDAHLPAAHGTVRGAATIGQLLSHTSGAPAWLDFFAATKHLPAADRPGAVQRAVLTTPNAHIAGATAVYSDLGYMALGWLLEQLTGQPLDALFHERVAKPLGLNAGFRRISTTANTHATAGATERIVATEIWPARCADGRPLQGIVHDDNCAALDGVAGHAGLFGSVADVALWAGQWLAAVRDPVTPFSGPLQLPSRLCRELATLTGCPATTWRHGWDTPSRPGSSAGESAPVDAFGHLGFTGTSVWFAPSDNALVVLLTNRVHPTRQSVDGIRQLRPQVHDALWRTLHAPLD